MRQKIGTSFSNFVKLLVYQHLWYFVHGFSAALKEQRIEMNVTPEVTTTTAPQVVNSSISDSQLKNILQRLDSLERQQPLLEKEELMFMKDEVLGEDMGTIRNRLGVVETQLQALGGSIAWERVVTDAENQSE